MWVANFELRHDCIVGRRCVKYGMSAKDIILTRYMENGVNTFITLSTLSGRIRDINKFLIDLKKDKTILGFEHKGNTLLMKSTNQNMISQFYDNRIFFINPALNATDGHEEWLVGSWDNDVLRSFVHNVKRISDDFELKQLTNQKVDSVYFAKVGPQLSPQQKSVFEMAINHGYFDWPRRTNMRKLAERANISVSTFQEHLRKAEAKLIASIRQK